MTGVKDQMARDAVAETTNKTATTPNFEFALGQPVAVNITGRVVGRSEFADGSPSYLVEHERKGKPVREWIIGDKLVSDKSPW